MVTIGFRISKSILAGHRKVDDLIEFAGPILSLYRDGEGNPLLRFWANQDEHVNRWLVIPITVEQLNDYLFRKLSLKELLQHPDGGAVMLVDTDEDQVLEQLTLLQASEIPSEYLPAEHSYYTFDPKYYSFTSLTANSRVSSEYLSDIEITASGIVNNRTISEFQVAA